MAYQKECGPTYQARPHTSRRTQEIIQQLNGSDEMQGIGEIFFKAFAVCLPLLLLGEVFVW